MVTDEKLRSREELNKALAIVVESNIDLGIKLISYVVGLECFQRYALAAVKSTDDGQVIQQLIIEDAEKNPALPIELPSITFDGTRVIVSNG